MMYTNDYRNHFANLDVFQTEILISRMKQSAFKASRDHPLKVAKMTNYVTWSRKHGLIEFSVLAY